MGVMPCSRKDCDNIMCDCHIKGHGYICSECLAELREKLQGEENTKSKLDDKIALFLLSNKDDDKITSLDELISYRN